MVEWIVAFDKLMFVQPKLQVQSTNTNSGKTSTMNWGQTGEKCEGEMRRSVGKVLSVLQH